MGATNWQHIQLPNCLPRVSQLDERIRNTKITTGLKRIGQVSSSGTTHRTLRKERGLGNFIIRGGPVGQDMMGPKDRTNRLVDSRAFMLARRADSLLREARHRRFNRERLGFFELPLRLSLCTIRDTVLQRHQYGRRKVLVNALDHRRCGRLLHRTKDSATTCSAECRTNSAGMKSQRTTATPRSKRSR